jgi:cyclic pyranopterin phosphate synthase
VSITDNCNLACFFCSNEGLGLASRNQISVEPEDFRYLIEVLGEHGLANVSLSGGDPTAHPAAREMVEIVNRSSVSQRFYHTNGILLTKDGLAEALGEFTKIGVSLHGTNPERYRQVTGGRPHQYEQVISGLRTLGEKGLGKKVEVKHVTVKGMNDDEDSLKGTLDLCAQYGFKFKFLNFEAIQPWQTDLVQPVKVITDRIQSLGAVPLPKQGERFRGQTNYLPIQWYSYGGTKGVVIEVGCGKPNVCATCHDSNEIYVTPKLELKPCKMSDHVIPLKPAIDARDESALVGAILGSRTFLQTQPGLNKRFWEQR